MNATDVEWPDPADDPDDEPHEPWAKEGDETGGAETDPDPES